MNGLQLSLILKAVDRMSGPLRRVGRNFSTTTRGMRDAARRTASAMRRLGRASKKLNEVGRNMALKVTAPVAGFGALILRTAAKFELGMNRVGVLTSATGDQLAKLRTQARDLGATTQFSASQAADAMGFLAMAGFDANKIMSSMPGTLQLAAAAQMDLAQAADIVSNVMTGYNLNASEIGRVNDVLVKSFTSANTDLSQLGEAMKYAGPVASGFGLQIEETAAALSLMGNAGFQGSMAGTALRGALSKLANPARDAAKALHRLGIKKTDLFDQQGKLTSFTNVIRRLGEAGAGADEMLLIFGDRAGPAMQALVSQGAGAVAKLTGQLENAGGTAKRVADAQMKGATGEIRKLGSAFEGLQLAIADSGLLQWFSRIVVKLTSWVSSLSLANKELLKWGSVVALAAAAIAPLVLALGMLGFAISGIATAILVLSGPVGIVVGALALLAGVAVLIYEKWLPIKAFFIGLWDSFIGHVDAAVGFIYEKWKPVKAFFTGLWDGVIGGIDATVSRLKSAFSGMTSWMPKPMLDLFGFNPARRPSSPTGVRAGSAYATSQPTAKAEVGGAIHIVIDSSGRPKVTSVKSDTLGFDLNVDAGMAMAGS